MKRTRLARRPTASLVVLTLGVGGLLAGCSSEHGTGPGVITSVVPTSTTRTTDQEPHGEIWEWALGRNAWADPALAGLASSLGRSSKSNILVHPRGFELDLDGSGAVVAVVLYNDETALGLPASESSFLAYGGALPAGLSWRDSHDTVVARHGEGDLVVGGWGVEYTFRYETTDGVRVDVTYMAKHEDALAGSPIHTVTVRPANT
jgi:hypothetical protein